jgi:putative membrane protein
LSKSAETIPYGRIQAVRMIEPFCWRPLGWYRLEIHLAGSARKKANEPSRPVRRALLPVGSKNDAELFLRWVLPDHVATLTKPPRRAMLRAPLSYHFLAAGRNSYCAVSVSGRVRRMTEFAPLSKLQSIRSTQGPVQRWLRLGSIHLDVAGRRAGVGWLHRSVAEADEWMHTLPPECERARSLESGPSLDPPPPSLPGLPLPAPEASGTGPFIGTAPNA